MKRFILWEAIVGLVIALIVSLIVYSFRLHAQNGLFEQIVPVIGYVWVGLLTYVIPFLLSFYLLQLRSKFKSNNAITSNAILFLVYGFKIILSIILLIVALFIARHDMLYVVAGYVSASVTYIFVMRKC